MESSSGAQVLFAQAWHPEFAAVERTTELRARASSFGLSEDEVKAATKTVNDHAKKEWEKTAKVWRMNSEGLESMKKTLQNKEDDKIKAKEEAEEAKRKEEEAGDEERKKNLEMLEKKRAEKRRQQEEAEKKRLARKKQLEEEKAKRDPWLLFPEVVEAEKHLEELKEQRRDANAKLEFDLSNSLTKDISAAERALKSATKKAKKAYKKGGKPESASDSKDRKENTGKDNQDELKALQAKLKDVKERKDKASQAENFKEAKKLKAEQKDLEEKITKLELWRYCLIYCPISVGITNRRPTGTSPGSNRPATYTSAFEGKGLCKLWSWTDHNFQPPKFFIYDLYMTVDAYGIS